MPLLKHPLLLIETVPAVNFKNTFRAIACPQLRQYIFISLVISYALWMYIYTRFSITALNENRLQQHYSKNGPTILTCLIIFTSL